MKDYYLMIKLFLFFLLFVNIENFQFENSLQTNLNNHKISLDEIIEYLAQTEESSNKAQQQLNSDSELNLLETKTITNERGRGCEAMNLCSGKGSCNNGSCVCDEGYDYFDCSVNVSSKLIFYIPFCIYLNIH